jgi:phosphopantothenoylcysteine synthetase/decarboxylase
VTGGNSSTGTVTLSAVAQAATTVTLASNNAAATVPASVVIPAGSSSRTFTVSTTQVQATTTAVVTASLNGTSRSATLTINPAAAADTVTITQAEYDVGNRRLRIEATSTRSNATLQAFVTSNNQLIGTLSNDGGGRYRGEFSWPVNPQNITVRSNFGGQATRAVTAR